MQPTQNSGPDPDAACYDSEEAVQFVVSQTHLTVDTVRKALQAQLRYQVLLGVVSADLADDGSASIEAERVVHRDLLPKDACEDRFSAWDREAEYVARTTALSERVVADVLHAECKYLVALGLTDADAVPACRIVLDRWCAVRRASP